MSGLVSDTRFVPAIAAVGGVVHLAFAGAEAGKWNLGLVRNIASSWLSGDDIADATHITWATKLAFNVAAYNLALAGGLFWLLLIGGVARLTLGAFLAIWLCIACAAALLTGVWVPGLIQGALGVALAAGLRFTEK